MRCIVQCRRLPYLISNNADLLCSYHWPIFAFYIISTTILEFRCTCMYSHSYLNIKKPLEKSDWFFVIILFNCFKSKKKKKRFDDNEDNSVLRDIITLPKYVTTDFSILKSGQGCSPTHWKKPQNKSIGIPVLAPFMQLRPSIAFRSFTQRCFIAFKQWTIIPHFLLKRRDIPDCLILVKVCK